MIKLLGDRFVAGAKIAEYLMNRQHPKGAGKAAFFERYGFVVAEPAALTEAISRHPTHNDVVDSYEDAFGRRSIVECTIETPDGRNPCIRSVWMREHGTIVHRFVTAYPLDRASSGR